MSGSLASGKDDDDMRRMPSSTQGVRRTRSGSDHRLGISHDDDARADINLDLNQRANNRFDVEEKDDHDVYERRHEDSQRAGPSITLDDMTLPLPSSPHVSRQVRFRSSRSPSPPPRFSRRETDCSQVISDRLSARSPSPRRSRTRRTRGHPDYGQDYGSNSVEYAEPRPWRRGMNREYAEVLDDGDMMDGAEGLDYGGEVIPGKGRVYGFTPSQDVHVQKELAMAEVQSEEMASVTVPMEDFKRTEKPSEVMSQVLEARVKCCESVPAQYHQSMATGRSKGSRLMPASLGDDHDTWSRGFGIQNLSVYPNTGARPSTPSVEAGDAPFETMLRISGSNYTGDAYLDSTTHAAQLYTMPSTPPQGQSDNSPRSPYVKPLFRWLHLYQSGGLNLDELSAATSRISDLADTERRGFAKLLARVNREAVKTRRMGTTAGTRGKGSSTTSSDSVGSTIGGGVRHMEATNPIRTSISSESSGSSHRPSLMGTLKGSGTGASSVSSAKSSKTLTWLCLPYFSLEEYKGGLQQGLAKGNINVFPTETLLQSEYSRTPQEREKEQVVCRSGDAPKGHCFHIAQVWCIILDNCESAAFLHQSLPLLVTCSTLDLKALRNNVIKTQSKPLLGLNPQNGMLYVSYYDSVLWAFPAEVCKTWFSFCALFHDFWPHALRFYRNGKLLDGKDWPGITRLVENSNRRLTLDLRMAPHPSPPPAGILRPLSSKITRTATVAAKKPERSTTTLASKTSQENNDTFHVFTWLSIVPKYVTLPADTDPTSAPRVDVEKCTRILAQAEQYLQRSTTGRESRVYERGTISTRGEVHAYLESMGEQMETEIQNSPEDGEEDRQVPLQLHSERVDLYNAADLVFSLFLPWWLSDDAPTVGKYWGAIMKLIEIPMGSSNEGDEPKDLRLRIPRWSQRAISDNTSILASMTRLIQSFQTIFSHAPSMESSRIEIPDSLIRAWLHLLMGLIEASQMLTQYQQNLEVAEQLIHEGMTDVMQNLPTGELLDYVVMQPTEIVYLLSWKLLQDSTGIYPSLSDTYSDYVKQLEYKVTAAPDVSLQYQISLMRQEVSVIRRVLSSQKKVVSGLQASRSISVSNSQEARMLNLQVEKSKAVESQPFLRESRGQREAYSYSRDARFYDRTRGMKIGLDISNRDVDDFSKLSSTDPGGFAELFDRDCLSFLERRDVEFQEFEVEASRLEEANANRISVAKNRQEAAVYAFTMVTIIFLPLSTVSSIFGMNTADIANMQLNQWVYWATALPTTVLVIVLGLWWMGELENLLRWIARKPRRESSMVLGPLITEPRFKERDEKMVRRRASHDSD